MSFNVSFALLAKQFEYPDILRQPTRAVLAKFLAGGTPLVVTWWVFMLSAVAFAPITVLLAEYLPQDQRWLTQLVVLFGTLAALVQFVGLARWPFMIPYLARESVDADATKSAMIDIVFQSTNRLLGVAIGEHLGYLFTGCWSIVVGLILIQGNLSSVILGAIGIITGLLLTLCALEFVGKHEQNGWNVASQLTPIVYILWSLWLIALGVTISFS